jgi:hypothetical protein
VCMNSRGAFLLFISFIVRMKDPVDTVNFFYWCWL